MDINSIITSLENAENDSKRFALLLILSELIKSNKLNELKIEEIKDKSNEAAIQNCRNLNERLFSSIDPHFLARLLTTRQTTENFSPILYKAVSLSILTQFLDYENLICDPILISKLDSVCDIIALEQKIDDKDDETILKNLCSDAFKYLFALSNFMPDHICQNTCLLDILINKIILNENYLYSKNIQDILAENYLTSSKLALTNNDDDLKLIACKLFSNICREDSSSLSSTKLKYEKFKREKILKSLKCLLHFAATHSTQTEFKLASIFYLNFFLQDPHINPYFVMLQDDESADLIFQILETLFKSKQLNKLIKSRVAFVLLDNFVKMFDFEFIYMKNRNFFYLIIHLLCVEIGLNLQLSDYDQEYCIDDQLVSTMSIYYTLLEKIIIILSTASPFDTEKSENSDSDREEEESYEPELKRVTHVIIECLETVLLFIKDRLDLSREKLSETECVLVVSSVRLLSCWVAHENLFDENLIDLVPKIVKFSEQHKNKFEINVYDFIVPALQRILIDQKDKLQIKCAVATKASKKTEDRDETKFEFEKAEINESIENLTKLLDQCYLYASNN